MFIYQTRNGIIMNLNLTALDTLFFRDGKPFSLGDETWADGMFPPNLSVLYGALRTYTAIKRNISFEDIESLLADVQIKGVQYLLERGIYLPLPCDLVEAEKDDAVKKIEKKRKQYGGILQFQPHKNDIVSSHSKYGLDYIFLTPAGRFVDTIDGGLISHTSLLNYLRGFTSDLKIRKIEDYLKVEPKVGIGRNNELRSTEEGMLFRVGMRRPVGLEILLRTENTGLRSSNIDQTLVKLGGEGKLSSVKEEVVFDFSISPKDVELKPGFFKLYLATPAIFNEDEKHWHPNLSKLGIAGAELVGACMGKVRPVGGFNMKDKKGKASPKPMYRSVPAGSVYYFRTTEDPLKIQELQGRSVSDELSNQGYGIAYFGNFNPEEKQ
ncbi:MAG: type III-B CRISPR module-associated protein Cmr3 [Saprospiraceae bacterium]